MSERTVVRTHSDGTFAVAIERDTRTGELVVFVRESLMDVRAVTMLTEAQLEQMLAVVRGEG